MIARISKLALPTKAEDVEGQTCAHPSRRQLDGSALIVLWLDPEVRPQSQDSRISVGGSAECLGELRTCGVDTCSKTVFLSSLCQDGHLPQVARLKLPVTGDGPCFPPLLVHQFWQFCRSAFHVLSRFHIRRSQVFV